MGRRNVRIDGTNLTARVDEVYGKQVHVVLLDGTTYSGLALDCGGSFIQIQDANASWTNVKRHTHKIALKDILEVIIDQVTAY